MPLIYHFLAFTPIIFLLVLSLWKGVKTGIFVSFIVTTVLFFIWGSPFLTFLASIVSALVGTVNILMIIFGAVFLYHVMDQKGFISDIQDSLSEIHPESTFRFYFLTFFLTAFFESVAGFGTPGAIVPLLLISMGFSPVLSISAVLLIDGLFALTGAVGTPVIAGLEIPLQLNERVVKLIYLNSSLIMFFAGIVLVLFVKWFLKKEEDAGEWKYAWTLYLLVMVPFCFFSYFLKELTGLMASVSMALLSFLFLFKEKKLSFKPWLPYWVLVLLLLLPKAFPWFASLLAFKLEFVSIYGTGVTAALQPFKSPLIPFLTASAFALFYAGDYKIDLKPIITKTISVFIVLFPSLAITQLMLNSGGETSMIEYIADVFVQAGPVYPLLSPLIGVLGAFVSGSTTVSNIIFGSVQYTSAESLELPEGVILSLQLTGASLGNAICLFNIIAAAAVAGVKDYSEILKKNLLPVFLASIVCSLIGYFILLFS